MAKLLAIDGLNIVRRIYEASPEPDSPEKAETALRFSLSAFRKLQHEHAPSHIVAAFDFGGPTFYEYESSAPMSRAERRRMERDARKAAKKAKKKKR